MQLEAQQCAAEELRSQLASAARAHEDARLRLLREAVTSRAGTALKTGGGSGGNGGPGELGQRAPSGTPPRDPLVHDAAATVAEAQPYSRHGWLVLDPDELQASESETMPSSMDVGLGRSDGVQVEPPGLTW